MNQTFDFGDLPLAKPPPGEQSNFINPPTRNTEVYTGVGIILAISSISMLVRLYTRLVLRNAWTIEDIFVWIGYAITVVEIALVSTITGSDPGRYIGTHEWNMKIKWFTKELLQRSIAAVVMFPMAVLFVKLSLFSLFLRLFHPNRLTRNLIYIGAATCSVFYVACFLTTIISCVPDPRGPNDTTIWLAATTKCSGIQNNVSMAQGLFGTVSDLYLLTIPIQIVCKLQLASKRKIGIIAVFMTGILAIACSLASLVFRGQALTSTDESWFSALLFIFGNAELGAGIICVNTPLFPAISSQPAKKPVWLRLPKNIHYFSLRRTDRGSSSEKSPMNSAEGITLHQDVTVEHGPNESFGVLSNFNHGSEQKQYHVDIFGGKLINGILISSELRMDDMTLDDHMV